MNIKNKFTGILISGDFNFHTIKWTNEYYVELKGESDIPGKCVSKRTQRVVIDENQYEWVSIVSGVLQRSAIFIRSVY